MTPAERRMVELLARIAYRRLRAPTSADRPAPVKPQTNENKAAK